MPPVATGPRVSVAMATYQGERHIAEQLDSLAEQTLRPYELVVSDDGSDDATVELVEAFAARSPFPVRILRDGVRRGSADNFLHAASQCGGELVAFCDQDDVWLPGKLAACADALAGPEVVLAVHTCRVVAAELDRADGRFPRIEETRTIAGAESDPWWAIPGMAMVFDARLLAADPHRRPPSHEPGQAMIRHDEWIYLLARIEGSIARIAEPLALYRQHTENVTGAPERGLTGLRTRLAGADFGYYATRRDQAAFAAGLCADRAATAGDPAARQHYERMGRSQAALAAALDRRLAIYAPAARRRERVGALTRLASASGYRSRASGGFGARALVKDAATALLAR
jgi:glycosyltransferase involved in cell wall biosynthesis